MPTPCRHAVRNTINIIKQKKKAEKYPAELPNAFFVVLYPTLFDAIALLIRVNRGGSDALALHGGLTKQKQIFGVSCRESF
jgi:hypothetical protein